MLKQNKDILRDKTSQKVYSHVPFLRKLLENMLPANRSFDLERERYGIQKTEVKWTLGWWWRGCRVPAVTAPGPAGAGQKFHLVLYNTFPRVLSLLIIRNLGLVFEWCLGQKLLGFVQSKEVHLGASPVAEWLSSCTLLRWPRVSPVRILGTDMALLIEPR